MSTTKSEKNKKLPIEPFSPEEVEQAREIAFDCYKSRLLFALIFPEILHKDLEYNRNYMKPEFIHHILDLLLTKAETNPAQLIRLSKKGKELHWFILKLMRNQIMNVDSSWNRNMKRKQVVLVGDGSDIANIITASNLSERYEDSLDMKQVTLDMDFLSTAQIHYKYGLIEDYEQNENK